MHGLYACVLQLSYAIGLSHPLAISVFHYGTTDRSEEELLEIVQKNFDLRLGAIIRFVCYYYLLKGIIFLMLSLAV